MRSVGRSLVMPLTLGFLAAGSAEAQRLWSVEEVTPRPLPTESTELGGVVRSPATDRLADPLTAAVAVIAVEIDYLRLGFGYLELPLPDGSVIEAENAVFEDRGGGDLTWTGEVPGAGYESVLFTVQDGYLVGWFGEPGGPKYVVHAGPDGRGTVSVEQGPVGDWCGVSEDPFAGGPLTGGVAAAWDRPESVVSASSGNRLDILVLYSSGTERFWRVIGGPAVGIRQLEDYLNMVFRNGQIPATANLIPVLWDPEWNHPQLQGGHFAVRSDDPLSNWSLWHWDHSVSLEVSRLSGRHGADLVHFVPDVETAWAGGQATVRESFEPGVLFGWSAPFAATTFAHEIGHNLGGNHEPVTFRNFPEYQRTAFRPYSFGHTDLTSCAKREDQGWGDLLVCPRTIMSYGQDVWDDPERVASMEPFYSSVRHKPNGWTIGVSGTSEVERLFQETASVVSRSSEAVVQVEQYPRRINARWTGRDTARVTWPQPHTDNLLWKEWRFLVALAGGGNDFYEAITGDAPPGHRKTSRNVEPILEGNDLVGVEIGGLRPAGRYKFSVNGPDSVVENRAVATLRSDVFELSPPTAASGAPAAPSNVGAQVTGRDSAWLTWRDNSSNESGFEVWGRKWSGEEPERVWRRYAGSLAEPRAHVRGLAAEEETQVTVGVFHWDSNRNDYVLGADETARIGRYSFVVVAYNDRGFAASETFHLEFAPGPFPPPTPTAEVPQCRERATGLELDGYQVNLCVETPGGERLRGWNYGLDADQSGLLYFFDRDNVEVLVKVLDGCAVNGHRWVFVAPVTNLGFRLVIQQMGPWPQARTWYYDSERRQQDELLAFGWEWKPVPGAPAGTDVVRLVGNPAGRTARTVSDTTAFACTQGEIAAARARAADAAGGHAAFLRSRGVGTPDLAPAQRLSAGAGTDCEPGAAALTLAGGYTVSMCYETYGGETGDALNWGLDSSQSALLYFFGKDNAEVLIKVLDGCGVNGHRWVFVAPGDGSGVQSGRGESGRGPAVDPREPAGSDRGRGERRDRVPVRVGVG